MQKRRNNSVIFWLRTLKAISIDSKVNVSQRFRRATTLNCSITFTATSCATFAFKMSIISETCSREREKKSQNWIPICFCFARFFSLRSNAKRTRCFNSPMKRVMKKNNYDNANNVFFCTFFSVQSSSRLPKQEELLLHPIRNELIATMDQLRHNDSLDHGRSWLATYSISDINTPQDLIINFGYCSSVGGGASSRQIVSYHGQARAKSP